MVENLIKAQRWAEGIGNSFLKAENWSHHPGSDSEKVRFDYVNELLSLHPVPCNEPGYPKLKVRGFNEELWFEL